MPFYQVYATEKAVVKRTIRYQVEASSEEEAKAKITQNPLSTAIEVEESFDGAEQVLSIDFTNEGEGEEIEEIEEEDFEG